MDGPLESYVVGSLDPAALRKCLKIFTGGVWLEAAVAPGGILVVCACATFIVIVRFFDLCIPCAIHTQTPAMALL